MSKKRWVLVVNVPENWESYAFLGVLKGYFPDMGFVSLQEDGELIKHKSPEEKE